MAMACRPLNGYFNKCTFTCRHPATEKVMCWLLFNTSQVPPANFTKTLPTVYQHAHSVFSVLIILSLWFVNRHGNRRYHDNLLTGYCWWGNCINNQRAEKCTWCGYSQTGHTSISTSNSLLAELQGGLGGRSLFVLSLPTFVPHFPTWTVSKLWWIARDYAAFYSNAAIVQAITFTIGGILDCGARAAERTDGCLSFQQVQIRPNKNKIIQAKINVR